MRDIYYRQELNKMKISNDKWLCKYCNKTFYSEFYLDMHFVNRHNDTLLKVEEIFWNFENHNLDFRLNNPCV
jgi:hypothetical protein